MTLPLILSPEVAAALDENRPVVALESTIITHGMPWPQNFETAQAVEDMVRDMGAVPATIAVLTGTLHVGLTTPQLTELAQRDPLAFSWYLCKNHYTLGQKARQRLLSERSCLARLARCASALEASDAKSRITLPASSTSLLSRHVARRSTASTTIPSSASTTSCSGSGH